MKIFLIPAKLFQILVLFGSTQWVSATMQLPELLEFNGSIAEFGGFGDGMSTLPLDG